MAGKPIRKRLGNKEVKVNRKLKRSNAFKAGKDIGEITEISYHTTKSNKEAIKLGILNRDSGKKGQFLILPGTKRGDVLIDGLLDCIDEEETELDELRGITIGFETEYNETFLNLKSIFAVNQEEIEEELEEEIEDEIEDEIEEELEEYDY